MKPPVSGNGDIMEGTALDARMSTVFDRAPIASLMIDVAGRIEAANLAAVHLLRHSAEDLVGRRFNDVVDADADCLDGGGRRDLAASMQIGAFADGSAVVQFVDPPTGSADGATLAEQRAFRSALLELSELSHAHDDDSEFYQTLLVRAVSVVPGAQAGSILLKRRGTDEYCFVAADGFDLEALRRGTLREHDIIGNAMTGEAEINQDLSTWGSTTEQGEWLATAGRTAEIVVNVSAPVFVAGEPVAYISLDNFDDPAAFSETSVEMTTVIGRLIADLLRRRELEAEVRRERESFRHLALHDGLTGLANRRHIETALAEAAKDPTRTDTGIAVLFVDIDDFKDVNDQLGHDAGDEVIIFVADALRRATRAGDLVGRWGGDEFMMIARDVTDRAGVDELGRRILSLLDDDVVLANGRRVRCRLSIGGAWSDDPAIDTQNLVRSADAALYAAKLAGKHTIRVAAD